MKICQANQFSNNTIITICFNHFSSSLTMHAMFGALIYLYVSHNLVAVTCTTVQIIPSSFKSAYHRAVIKRWGLGISHAYHEHGPGLLS